MNPTILLIFVLIYFGVLLAVAWYTSKKSDNESFFIGNRNSNWILVAFGMIGTSLSGVTFVSVPGGVSSGSFTYFQVVMGYMLGYLVITFVLLPLYYKLNLTSIYTYLDNRFGKTAHKTGASFFILSRTFGATARLYLVINILQLFILDKMGVPFYLTAVVILLMILLYTFEGGVKTIIYTDTLQTSFMLLGLIVCIIVILNNLGLNFSSALQMMNEKGYTKIINTDVNSGSYFFKHLFGGMFIAIAMTGLDQEMMQKNISVKTLKDSQKNMLSFASVLLLVNFMFLFLGGVLYLYGSVKGINVPPDDLFPTIALSSTFGTSIAIIFIIALVSALFPSVDGAITSLTSSYCIDILGMSKSNQNEADKKKKRLKVHLSFAIIFFFIVLAFKAMNDKLIIDFILKFAGITYGPLLGLFAFGILTTRVLKEKFIWLVCILAPIISLIIDMLSSPDWYEKKLHVSLGLSNLSQQIFNGYKIGNELILINGVITFTFLYIISNKKVTSLP